MKVAALVSGGVDSSVALRLMKEEGHDLTAFYLKIWLEDELSFLGECPWEEDLEFVRQVCAEADVPLEVVPLQREYREKILSYTIDEARAGRTPNPDILCNERIKFGAFLDEIGDEYKKVATGHYAIATEENGKFLLKMSPDPVKDQTYFLAHLSQSQLARALFPVGPYKKSEIREMAARFNLPNMNRKDSQGLCFLGKIKFRDFIKYHLGERTGLFVEKETGAIAGRHKGFWFYTVGQRRGLELSGGPWFVCGKNIEENIVYISRNYFSLDKNRNSFLAVNPSWISGDHPDKNKLRVKLRHGERLNRCTWEFVDEKTIHVKMEERDQGIAQGQFAVFYDNDVCLGCAMISEEDAIEKENLWEKNSTYPHSTNLHSSQQ